MDVRGQAEPVASNPRQTVCRVLIDADWHLSVMMLVLIVFGFHIPFWIRLMQDFLVETRLFYQVPCTKGNHCSIALILIESQLLVQKRESSHLHCMIYVYIIRYRLSMKVEDGYSGIVIVATGKATRIRCVTNKAPSSSDPRLTVLVEILYDVFNITLVISTYILGRCLYCC